MENEYRIEDEYEEALEDLFYSVNDLEKKRVFDTLSFPDGALAGESGLVAIGGDLGPDRLLIAYRSGIFPWHKTDGLIYWYCPAERLVLFPSDLKISKSMHQVMRSEKFSFTEDQCFAEVIKSCAEVHRRKDFGTWIDDDFIAAYINLHRLGHAHSVEVWREGQLVGGLYGVTVGKMFCGESMFSKSSNASKLALIHLCQGGKYSVIDCQVPTDHLRNMGGRIISREEFLSIVKANQRT